jgi:hypothetical protein
MRGLFGLRYFLQINFYTVLGLVKKWRMFTLTPNLNFSVCIQFQFQTNIAEHFVSVTWLTSSVFYSLYEVFASLFSTYPIETLISFLIIIPSMERQLRHTVATLCMSALAENSWYLTVCDFELLDIFLYLQPGFRGRNAHVKSKPLLQPSF